MLTHTAHHPHTYCSYHPVNYRTPNRTHALIHTTLTSAGAQEAVDNDDGSGYFNTTNNVVFFGHYGMKVDMAGHDNMHVNNLCVSLRHATCAVHA